MVLCVAPQACPPRAMLLPLMPSHTHTLQVAALQSELISQRDSHASEVDRLRQAHAAANDALRLQM